MHACTHRFDEFVLSQMKTPSVQVFVCTDQIIIDLLIIWACLQWNQETRNDSFTIYWKEKKNKANDCSCFTFTCRCRCCWCWCRLFCSSNNCCCCMTALLSHPSIYDYDAHFEKHKLYIFWRFVCSSSVYLITACLLGRAALMDSWWLPFRTEPLIIMAT